jgi:multidrug efflux pump subunit AcrB
VKPETESNPYDTRFYRRYRSVLLAMLRRRRLTVLCTIAVFILVVQGFRFLPNIFFPPNDKPIYTAEFTLPTGTPIERTEEVVKEIEVFMADSLMAGQDGEEGIVNWSTYVGAGAPRFVLTYNPEPAKPEYAVMVVNATSLEIADQLIERMERFCFQRYPDLRTDIRLLAIGPPPIAPVEVRISGKDMDEVFSISDRVKVELASVGGTKNIHDDWGTRTKKLMVRINQARAKRAGVTNRDIAISLQTALTGIEATQYREEDKVIPVTLRTAEAERQDIGKIETINVYSQATGRSVPLKQVADVEVVWQPSKILRRDRLKTVTVKCDVTEETTPIKVSGIMDSWLAGERASWDVGYKYGLGGELESSVKANESIMVKLPVAGLIIAILLVAQFNSIRKPFIILTTIPLGLIGVVIGLLVARSYFGFMTLLGIVSLAGIVINNAIVLLDRIKIEMEENGLEPARAVVESAQRRLRPILLTTATTMGGLIPLWIGGGPMWESMAIAIIFGLAFATALTLGVVPVLYSALYRVKFRDFRY